MVQRLGKLRQRSRFCGIGSLTGHGFTD
jgi:hypothetical protein